MKPLREWDSVGWGFLGVCFLLCYGPLTYWFWTVVHEDRKSTPLPYILGAFAAITIAGIVTVVVNSLIQRRVEANEAPKSDEEN